MSVDFLNEDVLVINELEGLASQSLPNQVTLLLHRTIELVVFEWLWLYVFLSMSINLLDESVQNS